MLWSKHGICHLSQVEICFDSEMSLSKQEGAAEVIEEPGEDGFNGGSPIYSNMEGDFHHLPSPQSWDLFLSPLWNFSEDPVHQSSLTVSTCALSVKDSPQSHSSGLESYGSPADYNTGRQPLKYRISQVLSNLKKSSRQHFLAQVWMLVKRRNRCFLTTSGAPFAFYNPSNGLYKYRMVSLMYKFCVDEENNDLGLPGRVFRSKLPEWSPNAQYYSSEEYPLLNHALHYNIQGILALPLFEAGDCCIGVLELITTSMRINYAQEIDLLCKALEAVELRSSEMFHLPRAQVLICNEKQQNNLIEIFEVLTVASKTYGLPLAQTWTLCSHCNLSTQGGSLDPSNCDDKSYTNKVCMSSCDLAYYVVEAHMLGFREACIEHHLVEGQGVIGRAFSSLNLYFCQDITQICKAEYPLVHYARMFGLQSCLTVPVGNPRTANDIYILEFFLPPQLTDFKSQKKLLAPLAKTIHHSLKNLQILSHKGFEQEIDIEIINFPSGEKLVLGSEYRERPTTYSRAEEEKEELRGHILNGGSKTQKGQENIPVTTKPQKEVKVTLEILQQLFGMSLDDAAKYLGVSRSTMKRMCRKVGITRWPSHKRNKTKSISHKITSISTTFRHIFPHDRQPMGRFLSQKPTVEEEEEELEPWEAENVVQDSRILLPLSENVAASQSEWTLLPIHVRHQQKAIKLQVHLQFPLKMMDLEKGLAQILKLKLGTFQIKYLDTENEWILMACDDDMQDLIVVSRSTCDGTVEMIVKEKPLL